VHQLLVTFLGPDQVWILARISVRPSLRADEVAALVSDLDAGIHQASQSVSRIDIITAGEGT
jgi:hypothetical protein